MPRKVHPSITESRVLDAVERHITTLDNPGFCIYCGEEQEGCEPDAREYHCDNCEADGVYGADEMLIAGMYHVKGR